MISGRRGSGTIFFANCCLKCAYCQNYEISQLDKGKELGTPRFLSGQAEELGKMMLELQARSAHNINLVSPTHYAPQIMAALDLARGEGLTLPVVYNTGGYDSIDLLKELDGKIDVYLPDLKYFDETKAFKYSGAGNYVETARAGIDEMFRQVGNIQFNEEGVAVKGLLVRHLVLPNDLSDSEKALGFLASLSKDIWISIMAQYSPQFRASEFPELARKLKPEEYQKIISRAEKLGLHNLYVQDLLSSETYLPDFKSDTPFGTL